MEKGYVQVYTGNGKGKTTAALGLAFRAIGRDMRVVMFQFLKGTFSGELETAKRLVPNFEIRRFGHSNKFFWQMDEKEKQALKQHMAEEYGQIMNLLSKGNCDIVILDEIMAAIHSKMISIEQVCNLIDAKPEGMELILTGRNVPQAILDKADLITEMKSLRHYYEKGVPARDGIEK